jgi:hypothetical protein
VTGQHRAPEPDPDHVSDARVVRRLTGGGPDPAVDRIVNRVAGLEPRKLDDAEDAVRALYGDILVRPGGLTPRIGCALSSHEVLGWCCNCPGVKLSAEVGAWRLHAAGHPIPDVTWARAVS